MRKFEQFKDKKVLIWGLGLNDGGLGMVEFFLNQGAIVTVTDGKTQEQLAPTLSKMSEYIDKIILHLGGHIESDFLDNDIIIRNPAIKPDNPYLKIAQNAGKQIEMEMSLFHRLCPCPIIGITGTRGKSTTTTLTYLFLKQKYGDRVLLAGNIGKSAIRELPGLTEDNIVVLELSSFQLDAMGRSKVSPNVALVTNIFEDHLNWHRDMNDYIWAKKNIYVHQKRDDIVSINIDNHVTSEFVSDASSNLITFSLLNSNAIYYLDTEHRVYEKGKELMQIPENIPLQGVHNLYNILGAISLARQYDVSQGDIMKVLNEFAGVEGRQQTIREISGIKFINDTTATSMEAMLVALDRFGPQYPKKIVMISGGVEKGFEYARAAQPFKKYVKALVLLEGTASEKMYEAFSRSKVDIYKYYSDFKLAIQKAYDVANDGDIVILCPAAASFNMFANEFDRGRQFNEIVAGLDEK